MGNLELGSRKTDVGTVRVGMENEVGVIVKNIGDAPLTINKVSSRKFNKVYFDAGKSGKLEIKPGSDHNLKFLVTPPEKGDFVDIIMIYSDARNDIGEGYKAVLTGKAE